MAGAAFGSCLRGWGVVARAPVGPDLAWQAQDFGDASAEIVAGAVLRAPGFVFVCQGQHLGAVYRAGVLSRARLWASISRGRRSTLEMQVLKSWQAQYFAHRQGRHLGAVYRAGVLSRARLWASSCVALAALWRGKC